MSFPFIGCGIETFAMQAMKNIAVFKICNPEGNYLGPVYTFHVENASNVFCPHYTREI